MAWTRRRTALACAAFLAIAAVILTQIGIAAGAWNMATRNPGYLTYAIDPALGPNGMAGARDALSAWDTANSALSITEAAWGDADVRIGWMDAIYADGQVVRGCACMGLWPGCPVVDNAVHFMNCPVPDGATIGVSPGYSAANGTWVPHAREDMRDLIAHEFGHNLGLHHNTCNRSHLMYGQYGIFFDWGYTVPNPIARDGAPAIPASG